MSSIKYKDGYKYQLAEDYSIQTQIKQKANVSDWIRLDNKGVLTIKKGYAWDGPSGPTVDTRNFMRGSLVHDAFYQLMREEKIPLKFRNYVDRLLQDICLEDGMSSMRAWWVYQGVHLFGYGPASQPEKNSISAP